MSEKIKRYALNEAAERELLSSLPFVGRKQAAYVRDPANPIAKVRSELHRVYAAQMAEFDADIWARVAANARATSRSAAPVVTRLDGSFEEQPSRAIAPRTVDALNAAFGDEEPVTRGARDVGNLQIFGSKAVR